MFRRGFMQGGSALATTTAFGTPTRAEGRRVATPAAMHGAVDWPSQAEWAAFSGQVSESVSPRSPAPISPTPR